MADFIHTHPERVCQCIVPPFSLPLVLSFLSVESERRLPILQVKELKQQIARARMADEETQQQAHKAEQVKPRI